MNDLCFLFVTSRCFVPLLYRLLPRLMQNFSLFFSSFVLRTTDSTQVSNRRCAISSAWVWRSAYLFRAVASWFGRHEKGATGGGGGGGGCRGCREDRELVGVGVAGVGERIYRRGVGLCLDGCVQYLPPRKSDRRCACHYCHIVRGHIICRGEFRASWIDYLRNFISRTYLLSLILHEQISKHISPKYVVQGRNRQGYLRAQGAQWIFVHCNQETHAGERTISIS